MNQKTYEVISYTTGSCVLGSLVVAKSTKGIFAIFIGDNKVDVVNQLFLAFPKSLFRFHEDEMSYTCDQVADYINTPNQPVYFDLDIRGSEFQRSVWELLQKIPFGTTKTYQEIAEQLGDKNATRAVASACAKNVLAIIVPCHRVIRKNGTFSGYRWGVERKRKMLELEAQL